MTRAPLAPGAEQPYPRLTTRVDPRVRQNLALVIGLQGRFQEAEKIAQADLPSDAAAANVAYLRQMLAQQNGIKQPGDAGRPKVQAKGT